jgi:hypothetical protein
MKTLLGSSDSSPRRCSDRHRAVGTILGVMPTVVVAVVLWGFVIAAALACGGAAKSDSTTPLDSARISQNHDMHMGQMGKTGQMGKMGEAKEMDEMAAMPPEVKKFHDTLAPRWHAEHTPQRMTDTCAAIPQFHADADAIAASTPPGGASAADWAANAKQLTEAVAALDATCKASDAAAFEQSFALVHSHFHGLMAAAGDSHEEHGKPESGEPEHKDHHH